MNIIEYKEQKEDIKLKTIFENIQKQEEEEYKTRIFYSYQKSFSFVNIPGNKLLYTYGLGSCFGLFIIYKDFLCCSHIDNNNIESIIFLMDIIKTYPNCEIIYTIKKNNKLYEPTFDYLKKYNPKLIEFKEGNNLVALTQYDSKIELYVIIDSPLINDFVLNFLYEPQPINCEKKQITFSDDITSNLCVNMLTRGIIGTRIIDINDIIKYIDSEFEQSEQTERINSYMERLKVDLKDVSVKKCIELFCNEEDKIIQEIYLNVISIFFY